MWQARYLQALAQVVSIPKFKEAIAWCLSLATDDGAENRERLKALELLLKYTIPPDWAKHLSPAEAERTRVMEGEILAPSVLEMLTQAVRTHQAQKASGQPAPMIDRHGVEVSSSRPIGEPQSDFSFSSISAHGAEPAGDGGGGSVPAFFEKPIITGIVNDMPPKPYQGGP